jgi:hypothetical protein
MLPLLADNHLTVSIYIDTLSLYNHLLSLIIYDSLAFIIIALWYQSDDRLSYPLFFLPELSLSLD